VRRTADERPEEHALVERAKQGDGDAYGELVIRYQGLATRTAFLITGNAAEAEEAAQDAFVKAYGALGRFREGAPFRPWLLRIVANEAINRRASARRHPTVELAGALERRADDDAASPEAAALAAERRAAVLAALGRLRDEDRLVISYRYLLDLSEAEMSEALGIARGTVKSRLSRAMARLREVIGG
jgi:RNA polymerase sigma factor (sigma-70 family)